MIELSRNMIRDQIADSLVIFRRGEGIFSLGSYERKAFDLENGNYSYQVAGSTGFYNVTVDLGKKDGRLRTSCDCPYPHSGCKHTVAVCLDIAEMGDYLGLGREAGGGSVGQVQNGLRQFMTPDEIKEEALRSRVKSAESEALVLERDERIKGEHRVLSASGRIYLVTIHDPLEETGHCTCPDFNSNKLGTCKHLIFALKELKKEPDWKDASKEKAPFIHFFWSAWDEKPKLWLDPLGVIAGDAGEGDEKDRFFADMDELFDDNRLFKERDIGRFFDFYRKYQDREKVRFDQALLDQVDRILLKRELSSAAARFTPDWSRIKAELYPYQKKGVDFGLFKKAVLIADEMGLGKTLQAITLAVFKKEIFDLKRVLVVTPSSLKYQWKTEIERFTNEGARVIQGNVRARRQAYREADELFRITNYEAVRRDIDILKEVRHDLVILDEAQRIKNFQTKTHRSLMLIPHDQSIVLTGTPLENRLTDLYAIIQFADPELLTPLWLFAVNHFLIDPKDKSKPSGYKNLDHLHEKIKDLVIRRRKEDVFESLPKEIVNMYRLGLSPRQKAMHDDLQSSLIPLVNKKFLTPIDLERIQKILLSMRMVCDSSYLLDHETNDSPKLAELEEVIEELVIENGRKVVIFTEWTTMARIIGKRLEKMGVGYVLFSGEVPVPKRQELVEQFRTDPKCSAFLSTDAGGVGLNLQNADCVINFELPWNPAKLAQRIGRVNRLGQKSQSIQVVNFVSEHSIEENVLAGIHLKEELFHAALDGSQSFVSMGGDKKDSVIRRLREIFGKDTEDLGTEEDVQAKETERADAEEREIVAMSERTTPELDLGWEDDSEARPSEEQRVATPRGRSEIQSEGRNPSGGAAKADAEAMQEVLKQGLKFLSSLSVMAGGKPLINAEDEGGIEIDKETGEVHIRFKLPV